MGIVPSARADAAADRAVRTMVPPASALPEVLPTDRLTAAGKARPPLREDLRHIASVRNIGTVVGLWAAIVGAWALAFSWGHPLGFVALVLVMGPMFARLAILAHEAAHRLLFRNRRANDLIGRWLLACPGFVPFSLYRRSHFAHHRDEFGPDEPDVALYSGYPISRQSWRRKLTRDALGNSGWKNLKPLLLSLRSPQGRRVGGSILGVQAVIWLGTALATGAWWAYPVFWLAPWMTVWRVLNRLRAIAEHGGMERSKDRRRTTHHIRQSWAAGCLVVPYNTGWHLAHHTDMGVPWRNLPRFHAELEAAGWITPEATYPSYRAFWRAAASG
ncbi:MAG: fatty acid desaturase family protein [Microthrixaceae bacterium]